MAEPNQVEKIPNIENAPESIEGAKQVENVEVKQVSAEQMQQVQEVASQAVGAVPQIKPQKSEMLERIEDVMEEDLGKVYKDLPADVKEKFKHQGEATAEDIEGMLHHSKVKSKSIFRLLFSWLKIIPGINRYFLQQEAKLKTDEIMDIKEEFDKR